MDNRLILIVDDNDVNCLVADSMLKILGYETKVAKSGKEALDLANQYEFALILMDWQMPEMNGFDTAKAIWTQSCKNKCVNMIAVTANAFQDDKEKCLGHGFKDVLTKPFDVDQLSALVAKHMNC